MTPSVPTIYLNGKFIAQGMTGVQRVAHCMLQGLDRKLAGEIAGPPLRWVLLCPPGPAMPVFERIEAVAVGSVRAGLQVWEQVFLRRAARHGLLVNLSGSAPAWARRQIATLHDAAVFDRPGAYRLAFVLWYRFLYRRLARTATRLVTVSAFSKGRLVACLGVAPGRIVVIPNGADHLGQGAADASFLAAHGLVAGGFVLAVGSDSTNKNLDAAIAAFRALRGAERLRLVVAGGGRGAVFSGGGEPAASGGAGASPEDDARIVRVGAVGDAQLRALYEGALALVFVSWYEGFGLPPLEAMGCGCPVLAARAAALPQTCGDAALYADPASRDEIGAGLQRLLDDAALRADLIVRGRARALRFTWGAAADALHALAVAAIQPRREQAA